MKKSNSKSTPRIPKLCRNKQTAYVTCNGQRVYFGTFGTPEAEKQYRQWVADYVANGYRPPLPDAAGLDVTVSVLCAHFVERREFQSLTPAHREYTEIIIRYLNANYGHLPAQEFGARKLRSLREVLIAGLHTSPPHPLARRTIKKWVSAIRAIFKYGASLELIPVSLHQSLNTLEPLTVRSGAKECPPVRPVSDEHIEAACEHLPQVLRDVIEIQLLTAARPGEILNLTPGMIDRTGEVWTASLQAHKTAWKGKQRTLYFATKAQALLKPYMLRDADMPLFSPQEAIRQRSATYPTHRRPNQKPNSTLTDRTIGERFSVHSYRHAIQGACRKAMIPTWSPNQLRHSAATHIRAEYGIEAACVILGHSEMKTTLIYAEADTRKALEIMAKLG